METLNVKTVDCYQHTDGTKYQLGRLVDMEGADYDITIIMNWPDTFDEEDCTKIIDFYFGEPYDTFNKQYVEQFIDKQNKIKQSINQLELLVQLKPQLGLFLSSSIELLKSQLVKLY